MRSNNNDIAEHNRHEQLDRYYESKGIDKSKEKKKKTYRKPYFMQSVPNLGELCITRISTCLSAAPLPVIVIICTKFNA